MIDREVVAYHEAGHAIVAHFLGLTVDHVTITPEGEAAGHVIHDYGCNMNEVIYDDDPARQWALEQAAMASLAGEEAQRRFRRESVEEWHGGDDRLVVHQVLDHLAGENDQKLRDAWWNLLRLRTERLVEDHWRSIHYLATVLLDETTINGAESIRHVIADAELPPQHRGKQLSESERLRLRALGRSHSDEDVG